MDKIRNRRVQSHVSIRSFYTQRPDVFANSAKGRSLTAEHADLVTHLLDQQARGESGLAEARKAQAERVTWRGRVFASLDAVARSSQLLAADTNAVDALIPVPRKRSDPDLIAKAKAVVDHATPLADQLVDNGLANDVLKNLPVQIQELESAIERKRQAVRTHAGAHASLDERLQQATRVRKGLDTIVRNGPLKDRDTVVSWRDARRVGPARPNPAAPQPPAAAAKPDSPAKVVA